MAATGVTFSVTTDAGTLQALAAGIAARSKALGKLTSDSIVAASITVLRSLKSMTATAPVPSKVPEGSYRVVRTDLIGGIDRKTGKIYCHVKGSPRSNIRPAIGFTPGVGSVWKMHVFKVIPANQTMTFKKNINSPDRCWYVLCENEGQARNYAERTTPLITIPRILSKERGMAKIALAMAQAKASTQTKSRLVTKAEFVGNGGLSARAAALAYDAGVITLSESGYDRGEVSCEVYDQLNYSGKAVPNNALQTAIEKAANSLLGAYGSQDFKEALEDFRIENPDAKFVDMFRAYMTTTI